MMEIVAWSVFAFLAIQFLVSLTNLLWAEKLPLKAGKSDVLVSVLIPARNEEANIAQLLTDLSVQNHACLEIIVYDDESEDQTVALTESFVKTDARFRLLRSKGLPAGWLGKNNACHQLAQKARGKYLLFLDADVRLSRDFVGSFLDFSISHNLQLASIFPKQMMFSQGEKLSVPLMHFILLSLLPLMLVRKSKFVSISAANGQCMMFESGSYHKILPHLLLKAEKVEDIRIARLYKSHHQQIACLTGETGIQCRMYSGFGQAVNGFSKNIKAFFGNSFLLAVIFWLITTFGPFFVLFLLPLPVGIIGILIWLLTRVFISLQSRQRIFTNLMYLIPQQISLGWIILNALLAKFTKSLVWKGRNIS
jgi:glycosyltransferase involved in cell wall biosynthesis